MVGLYLFLPFPAPNFFASWKRVEKHYSNIWNVKKNSIPTSGMSSKVSKMPVKFSARVFV